MWSVNITGLLAIVILTIATVIYRIIKAYKRKASKAGYTSLSQYLQATPRNDEEKRDAVDLALKGLVICVIGLAIPPLLLVGVFPLFYGARKIAYTQMGFGLYEEQPNK